MMAIEWETLRELMMRTENREMKERRRRMMRRMNDIPQKMLNDPR